MSDFVLPNRRQRVAIMGRTGSGKTQFGAWLLSKADFHKQPYVIVDYKGDDLLNGTDRIREIGLNEFPKRPGLYIVHPRPDQEEAVEAWLWGVWKKTKIGLYFDEAYVLPKDGHSPALRAILTQGRSKSIPAICLTQRPCFVSRFVFTESDYYAVFHLNDIRDRQLTQSWLPPGTMKERLPQYHCLWYDHGKDATYVLQPVPDADTILDQIETRLSPRRRAFIF